ncbi:F-box/LRR-repeat protein-like [Dorcoceras hygrometricum]|uniref:F-box/LRR-repeat protein-like n=1 Tax=Dorcoceras hygrometricum TaxID=472368 RepID=A0A2Z7BQV4_9LAMI|nr:F-box/LRR-repeat protein-like [Dorcoceras hygrometricum]
MTWIQLLGRFLRTTADITVGDIERLIETEGEYSQGTETEVVATTDEESMSIEDHMAQIPDNMFLPSVKAADITQIKYGQGIEIREVDFYKASLPQIDDSDKGKESLVEDSIQRHPAREFFSLICADIDFLVQLREQVIEDVVKFVNSLSFRRQVQEHKLEWTWPSNSLLFEGNNIVRSYFIRRNHRTIFSKSVHDRWAEPEGQVLPEDESSSSDVSIVYRSPSLDAEPSVQTSPVVDIISVPTDSVRLTPRNSDISLPSPHQSSSSASSMHFSDEILQDDDTAVKQILEYSSAAAVDQTSLPVAPTTYAAESFTELRASISWILINHEKASRRLGDYQSEILFKIDHLEKTFVDALTQQDLAFRC